MNALVILGHPRPGSFNHAIAATVVETLHANGYDVVFHDLCAEGFEPLLPSGELPEDGAVDPVVRQQCAELVAADVFVVVHPNWWGQPPAIVKGLIDRVIRPGVAYRFREGDSGGGVPEGLLHTEIALVFNTSNTARERELHVFGDPLERLWRDCILEFCGVKRVHRRMFETIVTSTPAQRRGWLDEVRDTLNRFCPKNLL